MDGEQDQYAKRLVLMKCNQVLLLPTMFKNINEKTFYVFGICNIISIPIVWAFYPESNQRTLEEMNLLFASDSWFNWEAEKTYARLKEENPELIQAARRGSTVIDPEMATRRGSKRRFSLVPGGRDDSPPSDGDVVSHNEKRL